MPMLLYRDVAGDLAYHAARVAVGAGRRQRVALHGHDFYEVMTVVEGRGVHRVAAGSQQLRAGSVLVVRPRDEHEVVVEHGEPPLVFVNIAVPAPTWHRLGELGGLPSGRWDDA
ncbi:MAG: cupin domain-containing protein, partial [Phycicoccus sp.]